MKRREPFYIHNHTGKSNFRLKDSINKTEDLLDEALEMGLPGLCISDHETIAAHLKAYHHLEENKEKFKDFTIGYGNEVYLVDKEKIEKAVEENLRAQYYHFILLAKNQDGHEAIRKLSSRAWENSFYHRGVQRVPLFKTDLKEIMKKHKGNVIASTACIGGEVPQLLLKSNNIVEDIVIMEEELKNNGKVSDELFNKINNEIIDYYNSLNLKNNKEKSKIIESRDKYKKIFDKSSNKAEIDLLEEIINELNEKIEEIDTKIKENDIKIHRIKNKIIEKEDVLQKYKLIKSYTIEEINNAKDDLNILVKELLDIFGKDFYIELQPSNRRIQKIANSLLYEFGNKHDIKCIITTDAHYPRKKDFDVQEIYLKSQNGEREVFDFYASTYLMNKKELLEYFENKEKLIDELIDNTHEIMDKLEPITFGKETQIPKAHIPEFKLENNFEKWYDSYKYINKFAHSKYIEDKYYLQLLIEGLREKNIEATEKIISRINTEIAELWKLSKVFDQPMSSYFLFTKELVDTIWEVSLVGPSRGSACCYYTNYLLDIVQVDAIKYDLPYWRFLSVDRGASLPDIDIDVQSDKRTEVFEKIKEEYGQDKVLMIGTFGTEATRSSVLTACRGYEYFKNGSNIPSKISISEASNISNSLDASEDVEIAFYGDKENNIKPNTNFRNRVKKYPGLIDAIIKINGLTNGRGMHAAGIVVFNDGYIKEGNAMMKTTSGLEITQTDMHDTEFLGGMKIDLLSLSALTRIRKAMDYLLEYNEIEWQGNLKKTYDKYLHPDKLDLESEGMYDMLYDGKVHSVFQFSTDVGNQAIRTINARSFDELSAGNALMRLSLDGEMQPIDKFVKFRDNIDLWYKELEENNLNEKEVEILKSYLLSRYGICDTQESLMELSMSRDISGYNLREANFLRKLVASQNVEELENEYNRFIEKGKELGTRKEMLDYVWNYCFRIQFG